MPSIIGEQNEENFTEPYINKNRKVDMANFFWHTYNFGVGAENLGKYDSL
jgi:hypothetical protein